MAPSQLVMSALKTLVRSSKHFEPVLICPVTLVSPQAPRAEQDFSADSLLTTFDRLCGLLVAWSDHLHAAWKTQGVVEEREAVRVATLRCPGDGIWTRPSRSRGCVPSGQGSGSLPACSGLGALAGSQPWPRGWHGGGMKHEDKARLGLLLGSSMAVEQEGTCPGLGARELRVGRGLPPHRPLQNAAYQIFFAIRIFKK